MKNQLKTRTVTFSYGSVRNASLQIPAEDFSVMHVVELIRESYFAYSFRPGCGLMSDEVLTSSIGQANFFAGALGGYETRLDVETFKLVKEYLLSDISQALAVAGYREPGCSHSDRYLRASQNDVLSHQERESLAAFAAALT
jgi:hypothetical protein